MARCCEGLKLVRRDSGYYYARFTHAGRRYDLSTAESDLVLIWPRLRSRLRRSMATWSRAGGLRISGKPLLQCVCLDRVRRRGSRAEVLEIPTGRAGEDEYAFPERMGQLARLELPILHWRQEVTQPA